MSKNKVTSGGVTVPQTPKLKQVDFVVPTSIDFQVRDNVKSDNFEISLVDDLVVIIKKDKSETVYWVPLSNVRVMIKGETR